MFEVVGSIDEFHAKAAAIGLEYLADDDRLYDPDDDFYRADKPEEQVTGRVYMAMPDARALGELLRLWQIYQAGSRMPRGFGMWRELFDHLRDLRPWGPEDRVPPETIAYWREELTREPDAPVRFEVELWFRDDGARRAEAFVRMSGQIAAAGGAVVDHCVVPEIRYDGVLLDLPAARIEALIADPTIALARLDEIMFVRPQSMSSFPLRGDQPTDDLGDIEASTAGDERPAPIAALLDGFPIQNHVSLAGRLVVDDPDGIERLSPVATREHGTAMASLILHGDLNRSDGGGALRRPLYVRPVLCAPNGGSERTHPDRLLIDVIYRAVKRMKEGEAGQPPTAPQVVVINLSLGDENRPFSGPLSPWARLLDHLSHRYRVLFLVSAGNVQERLRIEGYSSWSDFERADPIERERAVLRALNAAKATRTLLSPAEALNALAIGAAHADAIAAGGPTPTMSVAPYTRTDLPNVSSALGLGHRRIIKPEILVEGGREPLRFSTSAGTWIEAIPARVPGRFFGLKVAAPSDVVGDRGVAHTSGTSAATALATRAAHRAHDVLVEVSNSLGDPIPAEYLAVMMKALLVHGAAWADGAALLDADLGPQGPGAYIGRRDDIARMMGYGKLDVTRILECTDRRATLVGYGEVGADQAVIYRIPLPPGLEGIRGARAVTTTLAWFSPVNPRHRGYRVAALSLSPAGDAQYSLGVERSNCLQPNDKTAGRGTVVHERRSGSRAAPFVDGGDLLVRIACRASAGEVRQSVPFGLAVTLEVGAEISIDVYEEVRLRLRPRVRPRVS